MFPLELGIGAGNQKKLEWMLPGRERTLTVSSAVWIQRTNVTDTGRQRRPHGKNQFKTVFNAFLEYIGYTVT